MAGNLVCLTNSTIDADGVSFEGVGVTPDIEVPVFSVEAIEAGMDPALDLALSPP